MSVLSTATGVLPPSLNASIGFISESQDVEYKSSKRNTTNCDFDRLSEWSSAGQRWSTGKSVVSVDEVGVQEERNKRL